MHDSRRTRMVLGVLLVAALALITFDARGASPARGAGASLLGSVENAANAVSAPFTRLLHGIISGPGDQTRISQLQRQVIGLRAELSQARLAKADEAQLRQLLQLAGRGRYRIVAATVIASGPAYEDTVTIDAGAADGIKLSETVLNGAGLVGTVTAVSLHTSSVLLDTDAAATIGVRLAGTGQIGAATGTGRSQPGSGLLKLQIFDASAVLKVGQQLVTFGSVGGRPYVPGVPVGTIIKVTGSANSLTRTAVVRPFADDSSLSVVGVVIVPPRVNPRDSVLPPRPRPTPTPTPTPTAGRTRRGGATASPAASATPTAGH